MNRLTYLFCYDDHRGFTEDIRSRFSDATQYKIFSFPTQEDFIANLEKVKEHKFCKIAILGAHDTVEQYELIDHMILSIKKIDSRTGIIIIGPPDKMDEIKKAIKINIDAYIPKNTNLILRIHNIVKKLISEYNIVIFKKRRNLSFYMLLVFILICFVSFIIARWKFPQYF